MLIQGNWCEGIRAQCLMAEGPNDEGGSGKGVSRNWLFEGNYCDSYAKAQSVALEDIQDVTIINNMMVGKGNKAFALGKGTTGTVVQDIGSAPATVGWSGSTTCSRSGATWAQMPGEPRPGGGGGRGERDSAATLLHAVGRSAACGCRPGPGHVVSWAGRGSEEGLMSEFARCIAVAGTGIRGSHHRVCAPRRWVTGCCADVDEAKIERLEPERSTFGSRGSPS